MWNETKINVMIVLFVKFLIGETFTFLRFLASAALHIPDISAHQFSHVHLILRWLGNFSGRRYRSIILS